MPAPDSPPTSNPKETAVLVIDPQNDFLSEGGVVWDLVGPIVEENDVVENLVQLLRAAKRANVPVFYSPHYYTDREFEEWETRNPIEQIMFDRKMFHQGEWGAEFHPRLRPDENTTVLAPHKGLSNFWTGDTNIQFRQRGIRNVILAGMSANLCVESHLRDAVENGFHVTVLKDATAAAGRDALAAAYTNYEFIANRVATTREIVEELKQTRGAAAAPR